MVRSGRSLYAGSVRMQGIANKGGDAAAVLLRLNGARHFAALGLRCDVF